MFGLEVIIVAWIMKAYVDSTAASPAEQKKVKAVIDVASGVVLTAHSLFTDPLEAPFKAVELLDAAVKLKTA